LNTTFSVTGGSGPVDVTFSALLNMTQFLFTDPGGVFAKNETSYQLSIDGQTLLFMDLANQIGCLAATQIGGDLSGCQSTF